MSLKQGDSIGRGRSTEAGVQAPRPDHVTPGKLLKPSGLLDPLLSRQLTKDSPVSLGFETQMRMCFELLKLVRRVLRPNHSLREAGEGRQVCDPRGQLAPLERTLEPGDLG